MAGASDVAPRDDRCGDDDGDRDRSGRAGDSPNTLPAPGAEPAWRRVLRQFTEPIGLLLMAAAVAGMGLHERAQAAAIVGIELLTAAVGSAQEGKATRAGG